jgi:FkbM family methyltransferase
MIDLDYIVSLVGRSNATLLEVGANDGTDTRRLAESFPFGHVIAFEPDPRAAMRFRERVQEKNVQLFQTAVGNQIGSIEFHQSGGLWPHSEEQRVIQGLPTDWDQSGSIRKPKLHLQVHPWVSFENIIQVPITTLDQWASSNKIKLIDFIWADVQGAEADLIGGASDTLQWTRFLYTEFSKEELYDEAPGLDKIASLLPDFTLIEVYEDDALFANNRLSNIFDRS